jgi:hypothetical protein
MVSGMILKGSGKEERRSLQRIPKRAFLKKERIKLGPIFVLILRPSFNLRKTLLSQMRHHVIDWCKPWHSWLVFKFAPEILER